MDGRAHTTLCAHLRFVQYCLKAPMRVNVTSERISTHPRIKVKSGNMSKAFPSHEKSSESDQCF